jgi:transposase
LSADQPLTSVGWIAAIAEALTAMQHLVREAVGQGHDAADPAALAAQVRLFRSAALAGVSQTAARSGALMKKHNALARRLRDRQDDVRSRDPGVRMVYKERR